MNINKRLFGTPIRGKVRQKLEDRQKLAESPQPGESIESTPGVFTDNGKIVNELGSRTPFVRMWAAVKLVEPELIEEVLQEFEYVPGIPVYEDNKVLETDAADEVNKQKVDTSVEEFLGTLNYTPIVQKIENQTTGAIKYIIKKPIKGQSGEILSPRDQIDYASKIYVVGDHNYQKSYGEVSTNDSLNYYAEDSIDSDLFDSSDRQVGNRTIGEIAEGLFPQELKTNKFLKPQAGILGVSSHTEGTLGAIKKTTVNFVVHNFTDYDKIYNKYFLKPGATIFVDFGWSSLSELYNPLDLIESDAESFLYDEQTGFVAKNNGDVEVIRGIVTDYNSKVLPNGSVECEVTLTSSNSALLGFSVDDSKVRTIQNILNYGILYLAVEPTLNQAFEGDDSTRDSNLFKNTPNAYWSTDEIFTFNQNLKALAQRQIGSDDLVPDGNAVRTGVYINSHEIDDVYISLGLFEDLIINSQFGFGKGITDINAGDNFQIRMNSSNSFTTFRKFFIDKQRILDASPEEPPVYLYPRRWGNDDGGIVASPGSEAGDISRGGSFNGKNWVSTPVGKGSYSFQTGKYPFEQYLNTSQNPRGEEELGSDNFYLFDEGKDRIPVREIFVNINEIIDSFESQPNVRKAMVDILDKINDESDGVLNLKLSQGETDGELTIIDINHDKTQNDINNNQANTTDENEAFKDLFTFNVMSPNSIVKNYDLSFKIPTGNIGNMYAIQGMGHSSKSFPISSDLDDAIAMNAVDNDNLSIIYEPDLGSFRSSQISGDNTQDGNLINVYQNAKKLLSNKTYNASAIRSSENILPGTLEAESWQDDDIKVRSENYDNLSEDSKEKLKQEKMLEANISKQQALGFRVVGDFREYFKLREIREIVMKTKSNLLPYNLSLTTYGIGSVVPGDTFRVDYLPKIHLNNTYAQTMRVAHNINTDGWYTTLETQFRIRPGVKSNSLVPLDLSNTRLSPKAIDQLKLMQWHPENPAAVSRYELGEQTQMVIKDNQGELFGDRVGYQQFISKNSLKQKSVKQLHPYMSGIKILEPPENGYEFLSMVLTFTWTGDETQVFFPQKNLATHTSEQYLDYRVVDKLDWLLTKKEASTFTTFFEYLTETADDLMGGENTTEGNANMNVDDYSKWVNFPTKFEFGGYVSREDFYNPELDFMFDIGPESESRTSYAVRQSGNESIQVLSEIFNESVFERLMVNYGSGRMNEDGTINEKLMYTGPHQVTLEKNKSYYWYINGRYWAMAESGLDSEYQNDPELVQLQSNWSDYDKLVDPVILDKQQCKSYYWNNIIGGTYQVQSENKRSVNAVSIAMGAGVLGTISNPLMALDNTPNLYQCPDPVPNGEQTPNYANLDDCNANCEAECVQI